MLTAFEARAVAHLLTAQDYALHKKIEIRIWDTIQHGGTNIIYAGEISDNVINAFRALGYEVTAMAFEDEIKMYNISWENEHEQ